MFDSNSFEFETSPIYSPEQADYKTRLCKEQDPLNPLPPHSSLFSFGGAGGGGRGKGKGEWECSS